MPDLSGGGGTSRPRGLPFAPWDGGPAGVMGGEEEDRGAMVGWLGSVNSKRTTEGFLVSWNWEEFESGKGGVHRGYLRGPIFLSSRLRKSHPSIVFLHSPVSADDSTLLFLYVSHAPLPSCVFHLLLFYRSREQQHPFHPPYLPPRRLPIHAPLPIYTRLLPTRC